MISHMAQLKYRDDIYLWQEYLIDYVNNAI